MNSPGFGISDDFPSARENVAGDTNKQRNSRQSVVRPWQSFHQGAKKSRFSFFCVGVSHLPLPCLLEFLSQSFRFVLFKKRIKVAMFQHSLVANVHEATHTREEQARENSRAFLRVLHEERVLPRLVKQSLQSPIYCNVLNFYVRHSKGKLRARFLITGLLPYYYYHKIKNTYPLLHKRELCNEFTIIYLWLKFKNESIYKCLPETFGVNLWAEANHAA